MKTRVLSLALAGLLTALAWTRNFPPSSSSRAVEIPLSGSQITQSSPAAADFDGDGDREVVVGGSDGMLYVIAFDGTAWSMVWSRQVALDINAANPTTSHPDNIIVSSPAVGDIDNDGRPEIVVTVGGGPHHPDFDARRNGGVLVYRYMGQWVFGITEQATYNPATGRCENDSSAWRGWPQPCTDEAGSGPGEGDADGLWDGLVTTPALADLDGDSDLEIIVNGLDRRIHAWHHDGQVVAGWPISQWNGDPLWRGGISSPAVGDIDRDGEVEVVVGTMSPYLQGQQDENATVWAVNGDGSPIPGFPVQTEQHIHSSPALGDITGDGYLEIVVGAGRGIPTGRQNIVNAWRHDGTPLPNWPQETQDPMLAPPALGDIDGDGQLEVVIGGGDCETDVTTDNHLYALKADGRPLPGFPIRPPTPSYGTRSHPMCYSPVLADIDGDDSVEILVTPLGGWGIVTVEEDGTASVRHTTDGAVYSSPLIDDLDADGSLETVIAGEDFVRESKGAVWIWNEKGAEQSSLPWPMFHHNGQRTGLVPIPPALSFPDNILVFHERGSGSEAIAKVQLRNAGSGEFEWEVTTSAPAVDISPASGFLTDTATIQLTIDTERFPQGWTEVGVVTATATTGGTPVNGSPSSAPVLLFMGDVSQVFMPVILHQGPGQ